MTQGLHPMKVAVVGAAGMLGAETVRQWRGHVVYPLTRADLDVTQPAQVRVVLARLAPDVIINCTAYNRVDDAEDDPTPALAVNAWSVRALARAASAADAVFVHYSTDFVFDGNTDRPYVETDAPNPQSAYGAAKLLGEWFAADAVRHFVLRVESLFGGGSSNSTVDRMWMDFAAGRPVRAFSDRTVSPSHVGDVARATRILVEQGTPGGLFHCVNTGVATWLEVAERLREWSGFSGAVITPVRVSDVALRARRPRFAALSNARLVARGIPMPHWAEALERHVRRS